MTKSKPKHTKATYLLIPMLGQPFNFYKECFVNLYVGEYEDEPKLFMVLDKSKDGFNANYGVLLTSKYYYSSRDYEDSKLLLIFNVPEEFVDDYNLFLEGKYSKFSYAYKKKVTECISSKGGALLKIISPTQADRKSLAESLEVELDPDAEIISKPDLSEFIEL